MSRLTLNTSLQLLSHPRARTCCHQSTCQTWLIYLNQLQRQRRRYRMQKWRGLGVLFGQSRSLEISPFDRAHVTTSHQLSVITTSYLVPLLS